MSLACRGFALIEVTVAMALLAITAAASIALQLQSTHRLAWVFFDSQAMGVATEALALYSLGEVPKHKALQARLTHFHPDFRLTLNSSTGSGQIWLQASAGAAPMLDTRIQWPAER